jgi:prevent-host-death family protein
MCVMSGEVNVRELRQNLSKYLRRVVAGEALRVLDRGRAVAILAPLPEAAAPVDRLAAQGVLSRARLDLAELGLPAALPAAMPISAALAEGRREALRE